MHRCCSNASVASLYNRGRVEPNNSRVGTAAETHVRCFAEQVLFAGKKLLKIFLIAETPQPRQL